MTEYAKVYDPDGWLEENVIIKNNMIATVCERDITSCKDVFNLFWKTNVNILYVVDDSNRFVGVITNRNFLKQMKEKEDVLPFVNKRCSVIYDGENENILKEAKELFEKYHITTAIPVIDKKKKICFELRRSEVNSEKKVIADFRNKITEYENSFYLREEVACLRRILEDQDIVVIGAEERFDHIFGCLRLSKDRICYVKEPENAYEFMERNEKLVIDLSPIGYRGREDIYYHSKNGYLWNQFIILIYKAIELEYCTKLYQMLDNEYVTLQDFLYKYLRGEIIVSQRSIFTAAILEYLQKCCFPVTEQRGVFREALIYETEMNGVKLDKEFWSYEECIIDCVNITLQSFFLTQKLSKNIKVLSFVFDENLEPVDAEQKRIKNGLLRDEEYISLYSLGNKGKEYFTELKESLYFDSTRTFENDRVVFRDMDSQLVHIENGIRRTCFQPKEYSHSIYFLGGCTIWGTSVEDRETIPSFIQKQINQSGKQYRVVNLANNLVNASKLIKALEFREGDIFVLLFPFITDKIKEKIPVMEIGKKINELRMNKYNGMDCFDGMIQHCGTNGNILYSEIIYKELEKLLPYETNTFLRQNEKYTMFRANDKDLNVLYGYEAFREKLQRQAMESKADRYKKVGSIVMNCNPFTLGHRYLVEYALKEVDYLYLFVVEEDRSFFSFEDRYTMVKKGTEDLRNIAVIGSGSMIASFTTFPAYFKKGKKTPRKGMNSVNVDLRVFGQYIAPVVNIRYRFVGEEPNDPVTAEYNAKMKEILPEFGIQVIEIPRKSYAGNLISANSVRKLYQDGDFKSMKGLAPQTTIEYLAGKRSFC